MDSTPAYCFEKFVYPGVARRCPGAAYGWFFQSCGSLLSGMCLGEETRGDREEPESQDVMQVEPNLYYVEDDSAV